MHLFLYSKPRSSLKEQLIGVDTDIQKNAAQDNEVQNMVTPEFSELALFLAKFYGQMLKNRERLKAVIDAGVPIYTKEMALRDLASISIEIGRASCRERV